MRATLAPSIALLAFKLIAVATLTTPAGLLPLELIAIPRTGFPLAGITLATVALVAVTLATVALVSITSVTITSVAIALTAVTLSGFALIATWRFGSLFVLVALVALAIEAVVEVAVEAVDVPVLAATTLLTLVEPATALVQDAKIVIGELQVIFGVDPIALHLGVAGQVLVLFVQLVGVAARPVVDPVAAIGPTGVAALTLTVTPATTTATAAGLPIVDQKSCPLPWVT
ncbi:hypothetical protein FHS94_000564 [Sphingomonas aerophila]|uniref:Uncharacterized protein n=1 Tax=Sphingomonas aerophila TaxID=1344948 RepID=A0A7W9BAP6_9SPHN|nr:hypothetical protein [Sphingomonas aerophila]